MRRGGNRQIVLALNRDKLELENGPMLVAFLP
jgi:hypothetical protein